MKINIPVKELLAFQEYCEERGISQAAAIRGFIRAVIPIEERESIWGGACPAELKTAEFIRATGVVEDLKTPQEVFELLAQK